MKKIFIAWAVFVTATALLTGCSTSKESNSSEGTGKAKQEIAVSLPEQLSTLDTTQTTDKVTFTVAHQIFEGLYRLDSKSKIVPGLAKSVDISEDGKTYTFHLREGIKWSDGSAITSNDFMYAWKRLVDPKTLGPNSYWLDNVVNSADISKGKKDIDTMGLEAPDDKTFKVQLINPQPSFLSIISIVWLAPQKEEYVEKLGDDYASSSKKLLYSGPFVLEDWDRSSDTWTLKPNKEYYDKDKVKLDKVKGSTVKDENTGINLFKSDDLDLTKVSGQFVQQFQNDPSLHSNLEIANMFLDFNKKANKELANVHLRKAIALSINKKSLVKSVLNDGSKALNGLVPAGLNQNSKTKEDFRKYSGDYNTYDVAAAKKEWALAKQELGENKIELDLLVSDLDDRKKAAEYIQSQVEENLSGLSINVTPKPSNNVNSSRASKDYEISLSAWIAGNNDINSYFNLYRPGSSYNYGGYENKEFGELTEKAVTTDANDENKTYADYKAAEKILLEEDAAQVPIYQSALNYLVNAKVKNVAFHDFGDYYNLREAYVKE